MDNEKRKLNMDKERYYEWTKKLIDQYIKYSDYKEAFYCLTKSLSESDSKHMKELSKYYNTNKDTEE
tara:strand:+ start:348 stop:548 length:201 start_codon:yes stop_codon:yes gene_type:complete